MSRTSCGVASHSRLVMSALTITLLPEPVAPAISRCGILARSTPMALPATSRPRAKVRVEPEPLKSTSSTIRRSATMLKSLFGISIPTALLPGIGRLDPERASGERHGQVVRRPSIRLTLISGAGWTSYWVTTGPALRATILDRDVEAGQLLDDDLLVALVGCLVRRRRATGWRCRRASRSVAGRTRCGPWSAVHRPRP